MAAISQDDRLIAVKTPLGPDKLILVSFTGTEEMSRLFSYRLEMISGEDSIAADKIVGKPVSFSVKLADGEQQRFFHGVVSRFAAGGRETGMRRYTAEVVPWLWFLTRTADCRIFQNKSVPEIIQQIFGDLGFADFKLQVKGTHPKWDYCVQYRESDFAFVSRLMEQEGIFYYFEHEEGKHTLVLADHKGAYKDCPEKDVEYEGTETSRGRQDTISRWEHQYEFRPGKWATTDYDFEKPSTSLMNNEKTVVKLPGNDKFEVYDYPVAYVSKDDGKAMLRVRMEEEETAYDVARGDSTYRTFTAGHKFKFKRHDSQEEQGKGYLITSIQHSAVEPTDPAGGGGAGFDYANRFTCIPDSVTFRPARTTPKPFVQGPQTAVVVGPPGEEIFTDKYARVKVQFHWDREGKKNENSSCWVRVSQAYAGQGWGAVCIPRIGQEVVVDFLEGDPDHPLITGRVYNAEQMPPFDLPANKVVSGLKSNSTPGGGGYNELSFNDTKGKEKITLHGQYDMNSTIEHDETHTVHNNRTMSVDGTFVESVKKDVTMIYGAKLTSMVTGTVVEQYNDAQTTLVKSGVLLMSTSANIHLVGSTEVMLNSGASTLLLKKDGTIELSGTNITISATSALNLSGQTVNISGGTEVLTGVGSQTVKCDVAEVAVSGAAVKSSAVGNNEITGALVKIN